MDNTTVPMLNTTGVDYADLGVNWWGVAGVVVFYLAILFIGLFASWKNKSYKKTDCETVMLAERNIGLCMGIFTMTATWVGGGYINGTAEYVYTPGSGLVWAQAAVGYSLSILLNGLFFARPLRRGRYVTMLDPITECYGRVATALLYIPALMGDIFWSASILSALGGSLAVILGIDHRTAVIISSCIAVIYTVVGGLYSVAFTDIVQLGCIFIGLWLGVAFSITNGLVDNISDTATTDKRTGWIGKVYYEEDGPDQAYWIGYYIDSFLLITLGGIPWQAYFQRVLSSKSEATAQILSIIASVGCIVLAIPAALIGAIAKSTDWSQTDYAKYRPLDGKLLCPDDYKIVLPLVMQYLCHPVIAFIGLGAISAAVMSSVDSSMLSASTIFSRNIYKPLRDASSKKGATEREVIYVMRVAILFVGAAATLMAISVNSIYELFYLCSDLVYVILFPQFVLVIHTNFTNVYGSLSGFIIGMFFRLTGGEVLLGMPPLIKYPWFEEESGYQLFPFKTMTAIINFLTVVIVSVAANHFLKGGVLPPKYDFLHAFSVKEEDEKQNNLTSKDVVSTPVDSHTETTEMQNGFDSKKEQMYPEIEPMVT